MNIQQIPIDELRPYDRNPRRNQQAIETVKTSLREFGFQQPIVADRDRVIVVGHTRWQAARDLGMTTVPVVIAADLDAERLQAYRIMDNRSNELAEWDTELLTAELREILARDQLPLTGFDLADLQQLLDDTDATTAYTRRIQTPIYEPRGQQPSLSDLVDTTQRDKLATEILAADLEPDIRDFLLAAADRHRVFDYEAIAEYYCHASPEVQALMEASALIIIDFEQAIERGYVNLTENLRQLYREDWSDDT